MIITNMTEKHVAQVAELEKICFGSAAWSEKSVASELSNQLALWLVAVDEGTVVGYVGSQTVIDETDMMNVAVHPEYRRQGIGEKLVIQLVDELQAMGSHALLLEVRVSNEPAIALYKKFGFEKIGTYKKYFKIGEESVDADFMNLYF